jgi:hypothetical protein
MVDVSTRPHHLSQPGSEADSFKRPWRRRRTALLLLALLVPLAIWAKLLPNVGAEHAVPFSGVTLSFDGRTLSLIPAARCLATITHRAEESPTAIRILVHVKNDYRGPGPACGPGVTVHLRHPLGRRVVIDESTDNKVGVALPMYGMIVGKLVIATTKGAVSVPGIVSLIGAAGGVRRFGTDANGTFTVPSSVGSYVFSGHSPRFTTAVQAPGSSDRTVKGTCHSASFEVGARRTIHVAIVCRRP